MVHIYAKELSHKSTACLLAPQVRKQPYVNPALSPTRPPLSWKQGCVATPVHTRVHGRRCVLDVHVSPTPKEREGFSCADGTHLNRPRPPSAHTVTRWLDRHKAGTEAPGSRDPGAHPGLSACPSAYQLCAGSGGARCTLLTSGLCLLGPPWGTVGMAQVECLAWVLDCRRSS